MVTESHPQGTLNHFYGSLLPLSLQPIVLTCLVQSVFGVAQEASCVRPRMSQPRWVLPERPVGSLALVSATPQVALRPGGVSVYIGVIYIKNRWKKIKDMYVIVLNLGVLTGGQESWKVLNLDESIRERRTQV